jgi:hypothetical protein
MTFDERMQILRLLDLTRRQRAFLVTVALHGGFCLRRQYVTSTGRQHDEQAGAFLEGLVARGLASRFAFRRHRGYLYHLDARSIYEALGHDEARRARYASPELIARRIMLLDYVLAVRTADWYATEQDKVALFVRQFAVPLEDLPQRVYRAGTPAEITRYFVHRLPIAVERTGTEPTLVYLAVHRHGAAFQHFLHDHARLLGRLSTWTIVVVCRRHTQSLPRCRAIFERFVSGASAALTRGTADSARAYFVARQAVEGDQIAGLSAADIDRFRAARRRFSAPAYESLYANWRVRGDAVLTQDTFGRGAAGLRMGAGRLVVHELASQYEQFGSLGGRC